MGCFSRFFEEAFDVSSRKKYALLGALLRGSAPQNVRALVAIFLLVGSSSLLQGCKEQHHVGPCLSVEAVPPEASGQNTAPGAGRSPTMTAPKEEAEDMSEVLRIGPCLKIAVDEPEDMGVDSGGDEDQAPEKIEPREERPKPPLHPCLSIMPESDKGASLDEIELPGDQGLDSRERTRKEVLDRLAGNLPQDVLARLRRELDEHG